MTENIALFRMQHSLLYFQTSIQIATSAEEYRFARYQMELGGHHTEPSLRRKDFKDLLRDFFYQKLHRLLSQGALVRKHIIAGVTTLHCLISFSPSSFSYRYNLYGTLYTGNTQLCYE